MGRAPRVRLRDRRDDGAWLDGDAAEAHRLRRRDGPRRHRGRERRRPGGPGPALRRAGPAPPGGDGGRPGTPAPDTTAAWAALEQAVIGKAVDLLSGPGGLASFLRRRQLGVRLGGPSLPLDIGYSETIPAGIRNAVILRDRHCRWAGGCNQPASACEVHHTKHKANGGKTTVKDCVLLCRFHHQIVDPPVGLDPGPEPRRDHHRVEQGQDPTPVS